LKIILDELVIYPIQVLLDNYQMNFKAWNIFKNFDDKEVLTKALAISKITIEKDSENSSYLDTYANILYKLGYLDEAFELEFKAISLAKTEKLKKSLEITLHKMKNNKPTWIDIN
jgi:tetratricopeptide (TPR) repeat protein